MDTKRLLAVVLSVLCIAGALGFAKEQGTRGRTSGAVLEKTTGSPVYTYLNINNISTVLRDNGTADIDL
jgi:hypothetical protein